MTLLKELNEAAKRSHKITITTLDQFVQKAKELEKNGDISDMYGVFEYNTAENVRNEVYKLADPKSPEPFRSAMSKLGFKDY